MGRLVGWALLSGAVPVSGCGGGQPQLAVGDSVAVELERVRRENRVLGLELELAKSERPYLVLDLEASRVLLKSHGVLLKDFPIQGPSVRARRLLGASGGVSAALDAVWEEGKVLPSIRRERVEILSDTVTPPAPSGTVAYVPPTPQEATPAPTYFRIRYQDGRALLVRRSPLADSALAGGEGGTGGGQRGDGGEGGGMVKDPSLLGRFVHWVRSDPWRRDRLRIEVTLPPGEAGALYRAFLDGTPLLVLGPATPSSGT